MKNIKSIIEDVMTKNIRNKRYDSLPYNMSFDDRNTSRYFSSVLFSNLNIHRQVRNEIDEKH